MKKKERAAKKHAAFRAETQRWLTVWGTGRHLRWIEEGRRLAARDYVEMNGDSK